MKKIFVITQLASLMLIGCTKFSNGDLSFIQTGDAPADITAMYDITQDNSGMVTILPNGKGAAFYEIFFGDAAKEPAKVNAGSSTSHKYPEGIFDVKIIGHDLTGKTTEAVQKLTVAFRKPENFVVNVAKNPGNALKINISATALYETLFKVYFGDVENEIPVSFLEGQTLTHEYKKTGTYTIKVIALSGGAATADYSTTVNIVDPLVLPVTFESSTVTYGFNDFDGGQATVVDNPSKTGINTSNKVGKMIKNQGEVWGGSWIGLGNPVDLSANKYFRMKVFSPRAGAKVLLKIENASDPNKNYEQSVTTTKANEWEELGFDFTGANKENTYEHIVLIFELGTKGDGSANFTFYFDDIRQASTLNDEMPAVKIPLTFESTSLIYDLSGFDGGELSIIDNPQQHGINSSGKVLRMIKYAGQPWGGGVLTLPDPIDFSKNIFKMKVFSPRIGAKVLLKVENLKNSGIYYEKEVLTTKANEWEELIFDYSGINTANAYQKIVWIFDNGTKGDGTANYTFLIDDIALTN
ncbi:PKD domain-containing protein [Haoranjiania flava]|uniref:PKD domain-containing protein n=1 Tax=Haoranjiania flava TaxID=1856322 RepID=A0AAE3ILP6_9BACT|nr:PKD domain-containing protein [Haoranjiania flava]MCU7694164.1 PKD domain-containing protein [Haoranjiania flava]